MEHRHLNVLDPRRPSRAAIDDILERGKLQDWLDLLTVVRDDPFGPVAEDTLAVIKHHKIFGAKVVQSYIENQRHGKEKSAAAQ